MSTVVVVLENPKVRKVFPSEITIPEILATVAAWLAAGQASVRANGVCKSFAIGLHVDGPDCDHEVRR